MEGGGRASLPATGRRRDRWPPGGGGGDGDGDREGEGGISSGGDGEREEERRRRWGVGGCSMGVKRLPEVEDGSGDR